MTPPHLTRVHDRDAVKAELDDALGIVAELAPPADLAAAVFNVAAHALLLRVADPRPSPLTESALRGLAGRG